MIYTKNNPKLVEYCYGFEGIETFTGVVKNKNNDIVYYVNGKYHREDGYYDLNGIALDTRLMFNVYDSGITFLEQNVGGALLSGSYIVS